MALWRNIIKNTYTNRYPNTGRDNPYRRIYLHTTPYRYP